MGAPDEVREAIMGVYLAVAYGLLGVGIVRESDKLAHRERTVAEAV